jgi:hypothetical protein
MATKKLLFGLTRMKFFEQNAFLTPVAFLLLPLEFITVAWV